jgi:hypothetical protein
MVPSSMPKHVLRDVQDASHRVPQHGAVDAGRDNSGETIKAVKQKPEKNV